VAAASQKGHDVPKSTRYLRFTIRVRLRLARWNERRLRSAYDRLVAREAPTE